MVKVNLLPFFFKLINYKKTIVQSYKKIRKKNINLLTKINNELMNEELISLKISKYLLDSITTQNFLTLD